MNGTDYVVRTWRQTSADHARVTVVDAHGRIAHVTVHHDAMVRESVDGLIRDRLAVLPPHKVATR